MQLPPRTVRRPSAARGVHPRRPWARVVRKRYSSAEAFAAKGARVVVAARRPDELAALVAEIEARGGEATAVRADVSQSKDVQRMVEHAIEAFGRHLQRAGRPDEIAQAIVFLCSDEASCITGTTLTPDGGFTLTE